MNLIYAILADRKVLGLLLVVNVIGTIYGYYWYGSQLSETPAIFCLLYQIVQRQVYFRFCISRFFT